MEIEDLGNNTLMYHVKRSKNKLNLYKKCVDVILKIQKIKPVKKIKFGSNRYFKIDSYNLKNLHKKKLTFKLQYELNNLPKQIDLLKEEIVHFEKIIESPDLYKKDYELFISTTKKLGSLQIELENKEQRWLELMELN